MKNEESDIFSYLITNKDFRDWVLNPTHERSYYWKKWMDEHPTAIVEVKKAREFIERMNFHKEQLSTVELDDMLEKIIANENPAFEPEHYIYGSPQKPTLYSMGQWMKVAAILLICFLSAILIDRLAPVKVVQPAPVAVVWKTTDNPKGIKSKITLPDGTIVMLNSASQLKYPQYFSDSLRLVELKGEAFFEVVRDVDRPFIIQTERMTTEVLGTSFNIKAYDGTEKQSIAVVTGRVKVSNAAGEAAILNPNEMGLISKADSINKTTFDLKEVTGWKDGIITFKSATFKDIEEQLSLWYGVDFVKGKGFRMENVYTGEFTNETLENVMNGIAYSSGFQYRISDNKVFVYK